MRTGRALTVSRGGGGWCIPEEFFWGGKKLKKKEQKFGDCPPPKNWRPQKIGEHLPRKIGEHPEKLETTHTHPPKKIGDPLGPDQPPTPRGQTHACKNRSITLAQLRCGR